MPFADINWWAVAVATLASFIVGFLYFNSKTMFPVWWRAMGRSVDEVPGDSGSMGIVFGLMIAVSFVQATVLAAVIELLRLTGQDVGLFAGIAVGALMGFAFAAMPAYGHRAFAGHGAKVWLIESGGDILGLMAMGAIIGVWV